MIICIEAENGNIVRGFKEWQAAIGLVKYYNTRDIFEQCSILHHQKAVCPTKVWLLFVVDFFLGYQCLEAKRNPCSRLWVVLHTHVLTTTGVWASNVESNTSQVPLSQSFTYLNVFRISLWMYSESPTPRRSLKTPALHTDTLLSNSFDSFEPRVHFVVMAHHPLPYVT